MLFAHLLDSADILSTNEADARFDLSALTGSSFQDYLGYDDRLIAVVERDVVLEDHLELDYEIYDYERREAWFEDENRLAGLVITGNLTVRASILNGEPDYGPQLIVLGSVAAEHGVFGGSHVHVQGDATFSGLVVCHYNHGQFSVEGTTVAGLIVSDDHQIAVRTESPFWRFDPEGAQRSFLTDHLAPTLDVEVDEEDGEIFDSKILRQVFQHIEAGKPLLRDR